MRFCESNFSKNFESAIGDLDLEDRQKDLIRGVYLKEYSSIENKSTLYSALYHGSVNFTMISSIVIMSLLAFENIQISGNTAAIVTFWIVWSLSLLLAIVSRATYSFNLPRQHIVAQATKEKLKGEGMQFIIAAGEYQNLLLYDRCDLFLRNVEQILRAGMKNTTLCEIESVISTSRKKEKIPREEDPDMSL